MRQGKIILVDQDFNINFIFFFFSQPQLHLELNWDQLGARNTLVSFLPFSREKWKLHSFRSAHWFASKSLDYAQNVNKNNAVIVNSVISKDMTRKFAYLPETAWTRPCRAHVNLSDFVTFALHRHRFIFTIINNLNSADTMCTHTETRNSLHEWIIWIIGSS